MIDLYLKATTEQTLIDALPFARSGNNWIDATHDFALDIIGQLHVAANVSPIFHANIRCTAEIASLIPLSVIVSAPLTAQRIWSN